MTTSSISFQYRLEDLPKTVEAFWQWAKPYRIIAFDGDMGAGKTTFIHALCDLLQVQDVVSSPTFSLINEYRYQDDGVPRIIYHMDWYRIDNEEEAIQAGMEDAVLGHADYCFIEWAAKAKCLLPRPYLNVSITTISQQERIMNCTVIM